MLRLRRGPQGQARSWRLWLSRWRRALDTVQLDQRHLTRWTSPSAHVSTVLRCRFRLSTLVKVCWHFSQENVVVDELLLEARERGVELRAALPDCRGPDFLGVSSSTGSSSKSSCIGVVVVVVVVVVGEVVAMAA